jgi:hypothetical protein
MKLFLLFFMICGGCQSVVQGTHLRLEMNAPQQAVLFLANSEGDVSYGGGLNAIEDKTTWHGRMTPEERGEFALLISKWNSKRKNNSFGDGVGKYRLRVREGSTEKKFELPLTDTTATKVYDLLMHVADARFNETLNALPKPSVEAMLQNRGLGETR